jgi:hypothetical protein
MPRIMRKELRPVHDLVACDLCGRTILKGERIETFVASGERRKVCELCTFQALRLGWPRESAFEERTPERSRSGPRRSLWSRMIEWADDQGLLGGPAPAGSESEDADPVGRFPIETDPHDGPAAARSRRRAEGEVPAEERQARRERRSRTTEGESRLDDPLPGDLSVGIEGSGLEDAGALARRPARVPSGSTFKELIASWRREPREVHAVPTSREGKLDRALELFNLSEHRRTIAGIGRALGEPWVSAHPVGDSPAAHEVTIVVAWDLSWYRYRVDLGDADQAVHLVDRGDELDDLPEAERTWNAGADADGRLVLAVEPLS